MPSGREDAPTDASRMYATDTDNGASERKEYGIYSIVIGQGYGSYRISTVSAVNHQLTDTGLACGRDCITKVSECNQLL